MDKEGKELSRLGLRTISGEMSPEYLKVKKRLLGYLAASGTTVEQLARKDQNERANVDMISTFARMLPKAILRNRQWQYVDDDPYRIRVIQSNVIWCSEYSNPDTGGVSYRPHFILGRSGQGGHTKLLLACVGENLDKERAHAPHRYGRLFYFEPGNKDRKKLPALQAIEASDYPGPEIMEQLFDKDTHQLVLTGDSPGSTILEHDKSIGHTPLTHMSDAALGVMDANSYMHKIAVQLGIEAGLDQILARHETVVS